MDGWEEVVNVLKWWKLLLMGGRLDIIDVLY